MKNILCLISYSLLLASVFNNSQSMEYIPMEYNPIDYNEMSIDIEEKKIKNQNSLLSTNISEIMKLLDFNDTKYLEKYIDVMYDYYTKLCNDKKFDTILISTQQFFYNFQNFNVVFFLSENNKNTPIDPNDLSLKNKQLLIELLPEIKKNDAKIHEYQLQQDKLNDEYSKEKQNIESVKSSETIVKIETNSEYKRKINELESKIRDINTDSEKKIKNVVNNIKSSNNNIDINSYTLLKVLSDAANKLKEKNYVYLFDLFNKKICNQNLIGKIHGLDSKTEHKVVELLQEVFESKSKIKEALQNIFKIDGSIAKMENEIYQLAKRQEQITQDEKIAKQDQLIRDEELAKKIDNENRQIIQDEKIARQEQSKNMNDNQQTIKQIEKNIAEYENKLSNTWIKILESSPFLNENKVYQQILQEFLDIYDKEITKNEIKEQLELFRLEDLVKDENLIGDIKSYLEYKKKFEGLQKNLKMYDRFV